MMHLKTYTAGEDGSRLADMAKEFGLQNQRQPRKQVRAPAPPARRRRVAVLRKLVFDATTEDARMRAVYTPRRRGPSWHDGQFNDAFMRLLEGPDDDEDNEGAFPRFRMDGQDGDESMQAGGGMVDPHTEGIGGDLPAAILGVVKGMVGPCILYLPHGFACAGYTVALPLMFLSTVMYIYSAQCLLDAWKIESQKTLEIPGESRSLLQNQQQQQRRRRRRAMLSYPELTYRAIGPLGEQLVKIGIALMQSGVCLTYLIFVPHNLYVSVHHLFGVSISTKYWLAVMVLLQIPLSWIRDIRKLTPTNFVANALILYGLLTCLAFAFHQAAVDNPSLGPFESIEHQLINLSPFRSQWYLFIGFSVSETRNQTVPIEL